MKLYHATFGEYLNSIAEQGLKTNPPHKNWTWADEYNGMIFLSSDKYVAESFCEIADNESISDAMIDNICVLEIDSNQLNIAEYLFPDPFIKDNNFASKENQEDSYSYIYITDIPSSAICNLDEELSKQQSETSLDTEAKDMSQAAESQSKGQSEREVGKDR